LWIGLAALTVLYARGALTWRSPPLLAAAVSGYIALLPILYLHWDAFGTPFTASYRELSGTPVTGAEFDVGNIVPHALSVFVSPFYFDELGFRSITAQPLLDVMFLALLAPLGFVLVLKATLGASRTLALGYGVACIAATTFYLAYYFTGSVGVHNGALHYFKLWWPLWSIAAVFAVYRMVLVLGFRTRAAERARSERLVGDRETDRVDRVEAP
jgi:hypothetical protein